MDITDTEVPPDWVALQSDLLRNARYLLSQGGVQGDDSWHASVGDWHRHYEAYRQAQQQEPDAGCTPTPPAEERSNGVSPMTILEVLRRTVATAVGEHRVPNDAIRTIVEHELHAVDEARRDAAIERILAEILPGPLSHTPEMIALAKRIYALTGFMAADGLLPGHG